jgi:TnpA family transposase
MNEPDSFYSGLLPIRCSQWEILASVQVTEESLAQDWTLTRADQLLVGECRTAAQRCDLAIQLCVLRKYGRFLEEETPVPLPIVNHLCAQLRMQWPEAEAFKTRSSTRSAQNDKLLRHLGFRWFEESDAKELRQWLIAEAPVNAWDEDLWILVERRLFEKRVVQPGPSVLERLMCGVMAQAQDRLLGQLAASLPSILGEGIQRLLSVESGTSRSWFFRLKEPVPRATVAVVLEYLKHFEFLQTLQLERIDLRPLGAWLQRYAQRVKSEDVAVIKRWTKDRRQVAMACFLMDRLRFVLEAIADLHGQFFHRLEKNAKKAFDEKKREKQKLADAAAELSIDYSEALLQVAPPEATTVAAFWQLHPAGILAQAAKEYRAYQAFKRDGFWAEIRARHKFFRQYAARFLALPFRAEPGSEPLLQAVEWARGLTAEDGWELSDEAPMGFVPPSWRPGVRPAQGPPDRRVWEFALGRALRENLRTGSLYLEQTRRYAAHRSLVFSDEEWAARREHDYQLLNMPKDPERALAQMQETLDREANALERELPRHPFASVKNGEWVLKKDDKLQPCPEADRVRNGFFKTIAPMSLEQVMAQMDTLCGYSQALQPDREFHAPVDDLKPYKHAGVVSHGGNFGMVDMARKAKGLVPQVLFEVIRRCLRVECIRAADRMVINFFLRLPISRMLGDKGLSSSDGQRFRVRGKSAVGSPYPRRGGYYTQMAGIYTHLNEHIAFWSQICSVREREDAVMLAGLLEQDTDADPSQHTGDTHAYTDIGCGISRFGLCDFTPRLKNLARQNIFKLDGRRRYGAIDSVFSREKSDVPLVIRQWDDMARATSSLYHRRVSAIHLLPRLHRSNHPLARAFQHYGRIAKTIHILRWIRDPAYRKKIQIQLNSGESHHTLAKHLSIGRLGEFCDADPDEMTKRATCLNLLCNLVVTWNAVRLQNYVEQQRQAGRVIAAETLLRISPVFWHHINLTGTYDFLGAAAEVQSAVIPLP